MLECVLNISEGRDRLTIDALGAAAGNTLLDVHHDASHHRAVFTLAGESVEQAARAVSSAALARIDLTPHEGAHPRLGVVDVVPFVPLGPEGMQAAGDLSEALRARDAFCAWAGAQLALPCFVYGPERSLPEVRRDAFSNLKPACGPPEPHPTGGACCVGARPVLVAYNLLLADASIGRAGEVARRIRSPEVRALAFEVADGAQVSCNLIAPWRVGPADVFDQVALLAPIRRAELVGLLPEAVLEAIDEARWAELGLSKETTIEFRLAGTRAAPAD
jgi:glutamate formiminotransferase / 5-formyltetrahydrofolate cyclo-ligase